MNLLSQSNSNSKFISIHRETGKSLGLLVAIGGSGLDDNTVNNIQQLLINE